MKNTQQLEEQYPELAKAFKDIQQEQYELFAAKQLDYGLQNIAQSTKLETKGEKDFAILGLFFRINDKISRWKNLITTKSESKNETIVDTWQDISNYAIIAQLVDKGKWK